MPKDQQKKQKNKHTLGVIVPYRDRPQQLKRFITHMEEYLKDYSYHIYIVEQNEGTSFNRGKLLNIGFEIGVEGGCDYFAFHDIDMLPEDVDYSYPDKPLHLATHLQEHDYETSFFDYFGGVTLFTREDFETINGYSNEYWGWGFEDDDLLVRCVKKGLTIDHEISGNGDIFEKEIFEFDGSMSYIKLTSKEKSTLLEDNFTISVLVKPKDILISPNTEYDEYPIISIPGYNIGLFYNSFRRYFCQVYDKSKKPYSINTEILGERWVHLTMVYEDKTIFFYVDGELIDKITLNEPILQLNSDTIFIGCGNDKKTNKDWFYGQIANVEIYDEALTIDEVQELYQHPTKLKHRNFGDYISSIHLYSQVLPYLCNDEIGIDVGNENKIELFNIGIKSINQSFKTYQPKPHRRDGRFTSLKHKSNSSVGNRWIHKETRKNQLRFYNEVRKDFIDTHIDGINTLHYETIETQYVSKKVTMIKVEL